MIRRPTATHAATAIDQGTSLQERFSSALYLRGSSDPFALAVIKDAESTANQVSLHNRFPVQMPRQTLAVLAIALAAFLTAKFMPA